MIDTIAGAEASAIVYSLSETAKATNTSGNNTDFSLTRDCSYYEEYGREVTNATDR